jgi:hypothetical protein
MRFLKKSSTYETEHEVLVCGWLISLYIMSSSSLPFAAKARILFFFMK